MKIKLMPLLIIACAAFLRLIPHPPNFAPIAAIALFGGVYLPKKYALILPLGALILSDYFLGFYGSTMLYVYASFALIGLLGLWVRSRKKVPVVFAASLSSSVLFFLITNFGVWASPTSWYAPNLSGLINSYTMALPFFRNTLVGDLVYTGVFFGAYELARSFARNLLPQKLFNLAF